MNSSGPTEYWLPIGAKVIDAIDGTPLREELNWKVVGSNAVPVERFSLIKPLF